MDFFSLENDPEYLRLQTEMVALQRSIIDNQKRLLIIFEGRDTAGKGGAIMRFVRYINPRYYRIVALPKPTDMEMGQWYFQRYIKELPNPGEIVLFDRSWYNRAVVEPVMNFCTSDQYDRFINQVVLLEEMLHEDGLRIIKFWFSIDSSEQKERLEERRQNPLKQWKLSTVDAKAQEKWQEYTLYKEMMFSKTSTPKNPWVVIKGNDKDMARLEAMRYVLSKVNYSDKGLTGERLDPDTSIVQELT
ncbi:polyphosphate kinase 2, PA0141 family [Malonomonas rubra DSM 5091]|uniref:ADP/GDP-polyphosphate phosphotransferase n=1 Tax=Malonomonas rubra DSM 5091 TaxID=1122189 RepID=A0A1M6LG61_MALRU|nr:polyphosphate kinase 2 [Malonomonas rubra]SHJ70199.1 polyphosphate kinase 2, PA0141 family [Malonomonas rubra DSM 5091]